MKVRLFRADYYRRLGIGAEGIRPQNAKRRLIMIRKEKGGYKVLSESGKKNLGGPYKTKAEAQKRLRQVEFFKHKKG